MQGLDRSLILLLHGACGTARGDAPPAAAYGRLGQGTE
jgi:hypothetical protein